MSSLLFIEKLRLLPPGTRTGEVVTGIHPDYKTYAEIYAVLRPATAQVIVRVNDMLHDDPEVWTPDMDPYLHKRLAMRKYGMHITPKDMYAPHTYSVERAALFLLAEPDTYIPNYKPPDLRNRLGLQDSLVTVSFVLGTIADHAKSRLVLREAFRGFPAAELYLLAPKLRIPPDKPNGRLDIPPIDAYRSVHDLQWNHLPNIRDWTTPNLEVDVINGIVTNSR